MKKRVLLLATIVGAVLSLSACATKETSVSVSASSAQVASASVGTDVPTVSAEKETEPAAEEIYFAVEDVFTITLDDIKYTVVTGSPVGGTIYADDTLTFEANGEKIETKVVSFETMQGEHPTSASDSENIAVWLDKYLSETIVAGDKLVKEMAE